MPVLKELKDQYRDLALKAHDVVNSDRSAAEIRETLDKIEGVVRKEDGSIDDQAPAPADTLKSLSVQIADGEYVEEKRKSLAGIVNGSESSEPAEERTVSKSLAQQYLDTAEFEQSVKSIKLGGRIEGSPVELKATLLESGLTGANAIAQDRVPGIVPILFERLTVADLMPNTTTNSNVVRSVIESTATNAAATVAEGAAKPSSTLNYTTVDEPVRKIANYIKVSDEMLEDLPMIEGEIQGRLTLFVQLQEEAQILTGDGAGTNLTGILNRSGLTAAQAKGADSVAVAVHKEITKVRVASFLDPDGIVMHPNDWEGAALETDANGQFYGPGPFTGPYGNGQPGAGTYSGTYWGLRVVVTTAQTQNTALLGAFRLGASIARRRGVTVTMTNSDQDDFIKNLVTILAEERLALRVIRPSAFGSVTGV